MLKKLMTTIKMDANTTIPRPRASAWRPPAPLSRLIAAEVMVTSHAGIAEPHAACHNLSPLRHGEQSEACTERGPMASLSPSPGALSRTALGLLDGHRGAAGKIRAALGELDLAIRDVRNALSITISRSALRRAARLKAVSGDDQVDAFPDEPKTQDQASPD